MSANMDKDGACGKCPAALHTASAACSLVGRADDPMCFRSLATLVTSLIPMPRPLILLASGLFACTPLLSESRFSSDVSQTSALEWKGPLPTPPPPAGVDSSLLLAQLPPPGTTLTLRKLVTFALQN